VGTEHRNSLKNSSLRIEGFISVLSIAILLVALTLVYRAKVAVPDTDTINLNEASADIISKGLGVSGAVGDQILHYRDRIGSFDSCEQLLSIPTISSPTAAGKPQPTEISRHPLLLSAETTRPMLNHFIVRTPQSVFRRYWGGAAILLLVLFLVPPILRSRGTAGDPFLVPLAMFLAGLGVVMLFSVKDPLRDHAVAAHHLQGILFSVALMVVAARIKSTVRLRIKNYQYLWVIGAFVLVLALMVFGSGPEGVKLNLLHFQPVELIKLFLVFFLAGALAERADLIADLTSRVVPQSEKRSSIVTGLQALLPRKQDIGPIAVMFVGALALFLVIKDMGPGLLLFGTFIAMVYMLTGRARFLSVGLLLVFLGGLLGYWRHVGVFATRVDMWLHPFANTHPNGMQLGEALWGMASSGWMGSGVGLGMPGLIPRSGSDMAFASWAEETGIIGSMLLLVIFVAIIWRGIRIAQAAGNPFDRALATGLTTLLGLQTLLIVAGVTGLFPLSGIALPFVSYGNSALVSAFVSIGLLRGISATSTQSGSQAAAPLRDDVNRAFNLSLQLFAVLMICVVGVIRLGQVQIVQADLMAIRTIETPDRDHVTRPHINPRLLAVANTIERGSIYDRNGEVLATSRLDELKHYFSNPSVALRMASAHTRYYPYGRATANIVGCLDPAVGGPFGMERTYHSELRGFARYPDLLQDYRRANSFRYRPRRGLDLHLTLDAKLQRSAQAILENTAAKQKDENTGKIKDRGAFVLIEPGTGAVLVSATSPTYDPNALTPDKMREFNTGDDARLEHRFLDRSRYGYYPPGSTMKVATAACALDNMPGALNFTVTSDHVASPIKWQAGGKWYVRRHVREDEADPAFGALSMGPALRVSSNIYYANLAAALGSNVFHDTLVNRYGYSHVPIQAKFDADLPDIGYGQGRMLASPLEQCRMAACVANNGLLMTPRFVESLTLPGNSEDHDIPEDPVNRPRQFPSPAASVAIRKENAITLQGLMRSVVTSGTARNIFVGMPFTVAGKTGSAENDLFDGKAHSWFMGFAPCEDGTIAKYAFACVVENGGYGRAAAAPVCRDVLKLLK